MVNGAAVDELLARTSSGGTTAWYLTDKLDSVRDIVSSSGSVLDHVVYDSFGNIVTETSASNGDRFKFQGMQWDVVTGQYYDHARWYAGGVGRFSTLDPIGFRSDGYNLFRFVGNAPTNEVDWAGTTAGVGAQMGLSGMDFVAQAQQMVQYVQSQAAPAVKSVIGSSAAIAGVARVATPVIAFSQRAFGAVAAKLTPVALAYTTIVAEVAAVAFEGVQIYQAWAAASAAQMEATRLEWKLTNLHMVAMIPVMVAYANVIHIAQWTSRMHTTAIKNLGMLDVGITPPKMPPGMDPNDYRNLLEYFLRLIRRFRAPGGGSTDEPPWPPTAGRIGFG
jgi:RHS repeat-associated protein